MFLLIYKRRGIEAQAGQYLNSGKKNKFAAVTFIIKADLLKMKKIFLFITVAFITAKATAQQKTLFNANMVCTVPAGWYMKDSSLKKITLRKTGDDYSRIEITLNQYPDKDLTKFMALDKMKFAPDPHIRTIQPDVKLGNHTYKKVKYFTNNKVLKLDTELNYATLTQLKNPVPGVTNALVQVIVICGKAQETEMSKTADALATAMVY
jgi:hypothetical protein